MRQKIIPMRKTPNGAPLVLVVSKPLVLSLLRPGSLTFAVTLLSVIAMTWLIRRHAVRATEVSTSRKAQPKECPICEIINPPDADRCDCGYTFDPALDAALNQREVRKLLWIGSVWFAVLLLFFVITCRMNGIQGVAAWVASGAIWFGLWSYFLGAPLLHALKRLSKGRD